MRGVNKVILVGTMGKDPEVKYMPSGSAVCEISLATSESWKDKTTGEQKEQTEWHKVVFFGRLAEIVGEYLKKGSMIYVEGSNKTEKWQDKDGNDRYTTKVKAREMQMLGSRPADSSQSSQRPAASQAPSTSGQPAPDTLDDDIPF